jgi:hypothetical protein
LVPGRGPERGAFGELERGVEEPRPPNVPGRLRERGHVCWAGIAEGSNRAQEWRTLTKILPLCASSLLRVWTSG